METATLRQDLLAGPGPDDQLSPVSHDGRVGEAGNGPIRDSHRIFDLVGEKSEAGSQHDGDLGSSSGQPVPQLGNCSVDVAQNGSFRGIGCPPSLLN